MPLSRCFLALVLLVGAIAGLAPATEAQEAPRPDALIRKGNQRSFGGNDIYNRTGAGQSRSATIQRGARVRFYVQVQNDSNTRRSTRVVGTRESAAFAVRYYLGARQISPVVKGGGIVLNLGPGASRTITVEVQARNNARPKSVRRIVVSARDASAGTYRDNVVAEVRTPAYTAQQRQIAQLINRSRANNGRGGLILHRQLTDKAQAWAQKMAREGRLSHSNLSAGISPGWRALAENVGYGSTIGNVHNAFLASGGHRANMMGNFSHVGTGYATGRGRVWIVQVFMRR